MKTVFFKLTQSPVVKEFMFYQAVICFVALLACMYQALGGYESKEIVYVLLLIGILELMVITAFTFAAAARKLKGVGGESLKNGKGTL